MELLLYLSGERPSDRPALPFKGENVDYRELQPFDDREPKCDVICSRRIWQHVLLLIVNISLICVVYIFVSKVESEKHRWMKQIRYFVYVLE